MLTYFVLKQKAEVAHTVANSHLHNLLLSFDSNNDNKNNYTFYLSVTLQHNSNYQQIKLNA